MNIMRNRQKSAGADFHFWFPAFSVPSFFNHVSQLCLFICSRRVLVREPTYSAERKKLSWESVVTEQRTTKRRKIGIPIISLRVVPIIPHLRRCWIGPTHV